MSDIIYFIAGKGGSGKDAVLDVVSVNLGIDVLPIHITREPRPDDRHCCRTTLEELKSMDTNDVEVREYTHVEGPVYYATFRSDAKPGVPYLIVGPSEMFRNVKGLFHDRAVVPIVLDASAKTRRSRMKGREVKESERRIKADDEEWVDISDAVVVDANRSLEEVVKDVEDIIRETLDDTAERGL